MNLFDEVIKIKAKTLKSFSTVESYKYAKKSFNKYITNGLKAKAERYRITSIDASWIEGYKQKMGDTISETTKNDYIICLRSVFNHAIDKKLLTNQDIHLMIRILTTTIIFRHHPKPKEH